MRLRLFSLFGVIALAGCAGSKSNGPAQQSQTVTIEMEPWSIDPGADHIWCKTMKVPSTSTLDVAKFKITMTAGSHHFILYRTPQNLPDGFGDCGAMGNTTFVTGSQNPGEFEFEYGTGLALPLYAGEQLILQSHYVNASTSAIQGHVTVEMTTVPHASLTDYVETVLVPDDSFTIPAQTTGYTDGGMTVPEYGGYNLLSISSHMHKRGKHFTIDELDPAGNPSNLFDTTQWDSPPIHKFTPPKPGNASNQLHFQCWWDNETTNPIVFGPTTEDEMCIMVVTFFPAFSYSL